ncbi:MAG: hypothetical protein WAS33_30470 [Candidatus Promineifilaceae bacterium]|nr:hypothetical protein [Anaerolineaceae bacterium]
MKQEMVQQDERRPVTFWRDLGGVTMLLIGLTFLVINILGKRQVDNWWSFFVMLPGVLLLGMGRTLRLSNGRSHLLTRVTVGLGLIILTVGLMFALNLDWNVWWPLMIVLPGVAFWLVGGAKAGVGGTAVLRFHRWLAVTLLLLGFTFLANQLNMIDLSALFGNFHWWGFFILLPGIGAFFEGWRVLRRSTWAATLLLITAVWIVSSGVMELLAPNWLSWEGMVGIGLIGTGLLSRGWLFLGPRAAIDES